MERVSRGLTFYDQAVSTSRWLPIGSSLSTDVYASVFLVGCGSPIVMKYSAMKSYEKNVRSRLLGAGALLEGIDV